MIFIKNSIYLILAISFLMMFASCNSEENGENNTLAETTEAVTTEPPTTAPPEPTEPPHEHVWLEATFTTPQTCEECGETEGDVLQPGFERHNLRLREFGNTYTYVSADLFHRLIRHEGELTVNFSITEGNDRLEPMECYEWRIIHMHLYYPFVRLDDDGLVGWRLLRDNYYNIDLTQPQVTTINNEGAELARDREGNSIGIVLDYNQIKGDLIGEWVQVGGMWYYDASWELEAEIAYRVPVGHDEIIVGFYNPRNDPNVYIADPANHVEVIKGDLVDVNTLWFRLK